MTDKLRAACIALLKSAPDHIINEHWPELDEIIKALAEPDKREQQLQFAIRRGDKARAYAMELQKRLRQYEKGSPMRLNAEPNTMDAQQKRNQSPPVRNPTPQQPKPVEFYVYEWINPSDGVVFRSFRPDEHHMGRDPDRTIAFPEPHTGIDRGAWSDVPDATKWLDDLRGDEQYDKAIRDKIMFGDGFIVDGKFVPAVSRPPYFGKDVVEPVEPLCYLQEIEPLLGEYEQVNWDEGFPVYTAPPKSEWQGLTAQEKTRIRDSVPYTQFMSAGEYAMKVQHATEAELREKNT